MKYFKSLLFFFLLIPFFSCEYDLTKTFSKMTGGNNLVNVSNLTAFASDSQVTLRWSEQPSEYFHHIEITYTYSNGSSELVKKGEQKYLITGLMANTEYTFTVIEVDAIGNRTSGTSVTISTPDSGSVYAVSNVSLNKSNQTMTINSTDLLLATIYPSNATYTGLLWSSLDHNVATVDSTGLVAATGSGSTYILVSTQDGGFTATCKITVPAPVNSINLNKSSTTIPMGSTEQLTATILPANALNQNITWNSDDPAIATVSSTGLITAIAIGATTITAKTEDGGKTATCKVSIVKSGSGITDSLFNNGGTGANMEVLCTAIQSDGKILIGGGFTTYNGATIPKRIIRLNTNGTADNTFNSSGTGANGNIQSISIQSDDKIIIGGNFTQYNDITVPAGIIRLNSNGTIDNTFNSSGTGVDIGVSCTAIQSDGKVVIGGRFTTYNGVTVPANLIRLNSDGTFDSTFNNNGTGTNSMIRELVIQSDDKILIGSGFTTYNGSTVPARIIRLNTDGKIDSTFNSGGTGANAEIMGITIQSDGKIIIAGMFTTYNGKTVSTGITRLYSNGTVDSNFNNGGSGIISGGSYITTIAVQQDGKILIGGSFKTYNGISVPESIARLNSDGTVDNIFNSIGTGININLQTIALQSDGKIIIGGSFTKYNDIETVPDGIIRLNP